LKNIGENERKKEEKSKEEKKLMEMDKLR